jgi:hypothetical protein
MTADADLIAVLERLVRGLSGEWLEKARRFRPVAEVPIGELMAHPDLGDRLRETVHGLPRVEFGVYYRLFGARIIDGRLFALAQGTHTMRSASAKARFSSAAGKDSSPMRRSAAIGSK